MRIGVIGAGGVGGYFGVRLAAAGNDVAFVARGAHLEAIRHDGLRVVSGEGDVHLRQVRASSDFSILAGSAVVLVCTKLWGLEEVAAALRPHLGEKAVVVSLQNGVDAPRILGDALGRERVGGGIAQIGTSIMGPGVIRHVGTMARIAVGPLAQNQKQLLSEFVTRAEAARINAVYSDEIERLIWEKFVFLTSFSGVAALVRLGKGPIFSDPETRALYAAAVGEACAVTRARGIALAPDHEEKLLAFTEALPGEMKPSMLHDLEGGRRLELPWLSGRVAQLGEELGVATPTHRFITTALKLHAMGRDLG